MPAWASRSTGTRMFYVRIEIAGNLLQYADTTMVMFSDLKCGDSEGADGECADVRPFPVPKRPAR
jgi:hypothetical protein